MDLALLILVGMLVTMVAIAFWRGGWQLVLSGFKQAGLTIIGFVRSQKMNIYTGAERIRNPE